MARTTLDIDDALLRLLKKKAAAGGRTLQAVVNEHLKRAVAAPSRRTYRLELAGWRAELRPGVDLFDRDALLDLEGLANGPAPWAIPWPCVFEFLRVVTHPRVFHPPMPGDRALRDLRNILASPSLVLLGETERHAAISRDFPRSACSTPSSDHGGWRSRTANEPLLHRRRWHGAHISARASAATSEAPHIETDAPA